MRRSPQGTRPSFLGKRQGIMPLLSASPPMSFAAHILRLRVWIFKAQFKKRRVFHVGAPVVEHQPAIKDGALHRELSDKLANRGCAENAL
jgi:hypothetical protein